MDSTSTKTSENGDGDPDYYDNPVEDAEDQEESVREIEQPKDNEDFPENLEKNQQLAMAAEGSVASEGISGMESQICSEENLSMETDGGYSSPEGQESPLPEEDEGKSFLSWENALAYLGKNHALLRPFQEVKKKQLLKEKDFLILQIRQHEQQTEDIRKSNTKVGTQLYNLQEGVTRAQVKLDDAKQERENVKTSKKVAEENLAKASMEDENQRQELAKAREKERLLFAELAEIDKKASLAKLIRSKCDSDLTAMRHSLQSAFWDKKNILKTKDMQEFHVDRLKKSLRREENTLTILREASEAQAQEARQLAEVAREQQEELHAVERESKAVEKAWEENVSLMEKKSDMFSNALQTLISLRAEEAGLKHELSNVRKEVKNIQLDHEKETHRLLRLQIHLTSQRQKLANSEEILIQETEKKQQLQEIVSNLNSTLQETKKGYEKECAELSRVYQRLLSTTDRHRQLEDESLEKLSAQATASKANDNLKTKIKLLKVRRRNLEDEMVVEEQLTAREALRVSDLKKLTASLMQEKEAAEILVQEAQQKAHRQEVLYRRKEEKYKMNSNLLHKFKNELAKLIELNQGNESPPLEREERAASLELKEIEKTRLRLEQESLSLQKDVLEATKKRQNMEQQEHRLKQELQMLRNRSSRLRVEVRNEENLLQRVTSSRKGLVAVQRDLDLQLHQVTCNLQEATHLSGVSETEQVAAIKELEEERFGVNRYLEELKDILDSLDAKLTESMTQKSVWEKRLASAKKAKAEFVREKGAQGEMETMKKEINRMNVRWHTLEVTQKELSQRLAKSVESEDALKSRAKAALENAQRNPNLAKATREMQIDSLKRKTTQSKKALDDYREKTESLQRQRTQLQEELQKKQRLYMTNIKLFQDAENLFQDKSVAKQEGLILLQEERLRLRLLNLLRNNRYRTLAANNEEGQRSVEVTLEKRAQAYRNVISQILGAYPTLCRPLSAANRLLNLSID